MVAGWARALVRPAGAIRVRGWFRGLKPPGTPAPSPEEARKARLADALRENLKRRKAQARERREDDPTTDTKPR